MGFFQTCKTNEQIIKMLSDLVAEDWRLFVTFVVLKLQHVVISVWV